MPYNVYTIESLGNGERNHKAIYIETNPIATSQSVKGNLYHVTGTILKGMPTTPEAQQIQNCYRSTSKAQRNKLRPSPKTT